MKKLKPFITGIAAVDIQQRMSYKSVKGDLLPISFSFPSEIKKLDNAILKSYLNDYLNNYEDNRSMIVIGENCFESMYKKYFFHHFYNPNKNKNPYVYVVKSNSHGCNMNIMRICKDFDEDYKDEDYVKHYDDKLITYNDREDCGSISFNDSTITREDEFISFVMRKAIELNLDRIIVLGGKSVYNTFAGFYDEFVHCEYKFTPVLPNNENNDNFGVKYLFVNGSLGGTNAFISKEHRSQFSEVKLKSYEVKRITPT